MPIVLTVGSLHYDIMVETDHLPRRDETAIGSRWYPKFGGKGGNQAAAVARAGGDSRMVGAIGDDAFGQFLSQTLRSRDVDARYVATIPGAGSGMSVALQDRAGDYAATIVSGANLQIPAETLDDPAVWNGVTLLILQNEVTAPLNLAAATRARLRGIPTLLNAAPYRPLSADLTALIDILVVNAVEAEMMGTPPVTDLASAATAAKHLADHFPAVVVTAGSHGLALCQPGQPAIPLAAEAVRVVSSHGAGDAFVGTLATCLAQGLPLLAACQAASAAAARHVAGL
jgi:ribokinase